MCAGVTHDVVSTPITRKDNTQTGKLVHARRREAKGLLKKPLELNPIELHHLSQLGVSKGSVEKLVDGHSVSEDIIYGFFHLLHRQIDSESIQRSLESTCVIKNIQSSLLQEMVQNQQFEDLDKLFAYNICNKNMNLKRMLLPIHLN